MDFIKDLLNGNLTMDEVVQLIIGAAQVAILFIAGVVGAFVKKKIVDFGTRNSKLEEVIQDKLDNAIEKITQDNKKLNNIIISVLAKNNVGVSDLKLLLASIDNDLVDEKVIEAVEDKIEELEKKEEEEKRIYEEETKVDKQTLEDLIRTEL